MQSYQWSDQLSIGIEEIDLQHKNLVELLGELQQKLLSKLSDVEILEVLRRLQNYAKEHFSLEEALMEPLKAQVPNYALHISEHRNFEDTVQGLMYRFVQEGHDVAWQMFIFLGDWLVRHIQQTDAVLGRSMRQQA